MKDITNRTDVAKHMITAAALVIIIAGLHRASSLIVPFILAAFIAVICSSPLFWLKRKGVPTAVATIIVVVGLALLGVIVLGIVGVSLNEFTRTLPTYQANIEERTQGLFAWMAQMGFNGLDKGMIKTLDPGAAMQLVAVVLNGLKKVLTNGFLIILTVIFILLEASSFPVKLKAILADPDSASGNFKKFSDKLQSYIAIKTLTSMATGIIIGVWLWILGVDNPLLWGFIAFLFNYIPTIGSILAAIPAALLAFVQLGTGYMVLVIIGYFAVNISIGNLIEPKVMGRGLGLSTLVVFLSLVFWGYIFGPVGMLLAVPLTMTVKIALDSYEDTRWIATMLGSESAE